MLALPCSGCHGDGGGAISSLQGRTADQVLVPLLQYKTDAMGTTVMHRMMRGYTVSEIEAISNYLARDPSN